MALQDIYPIAIIIVFALGILQTMLFLLGLGGLEADGADASFDANGGFDPVMDVELAEGFDLPDADAANSIETAPLSGWELLGSRQVPIVVRIVFFLAGLGSCGMILSGLLPDANIALQVAILIFAIQAGRWMARILSRLFLKIVPGLETTAVNLSHLRRARGSVVVGTMTSERAAQVRITDRFGGQHDIMATASRPDCQIPAGAEVVIVRQLDPDTLRASYLAIQTG